MPGDVTLEARIIVVCGSSGSGKSAWVKQQLAGAARVCAWDPDGEYAELRGFTAITRARDLPRVLARSRAGRFAFVAPLAAFDHWALCVFGWGNCVAIAEETADVTSPGKAPPGFGQLIRKGRRRGITLYAITQRPSESDKTALGNATRLHVCQMVRAKDRAYMAAELDCPPENLAALKPLEFIERDMRTGEILRGIVKF